MRLIKIIIGLGGLFYLSAESLAEGEHKESLQKLMQQWAKEDKEKRCFSLAKQAAELYMSDKGLRKKPKRLSEIDYLKYEMRSLKEGGFEKRLKSFRSCVDFLEEQSFYSEIRKRKHKKSPSRKLYKRTSSRY